MTHSIAKSDRTHCDLCGRPGSFPERVDRGEGEAADITEILCGTCSQELVDAGVRGFGLERWERDCLAALEGVRAEGLAFG